MRVLQFLSADVEETAELPQLHLVEFWTGCCMPAVCNDRCRIVDDMVQFIDIYGRPCGHAETVATVEVPQIQFIARVRGQSSCATGNGTRLSAFLVLAAMKGVFDAFCVIFRAPPVVPELSASFSSFRALTTVSARGLQGVPESPGV